MVSEDPSNPGHGPTIIDGTTLHQINEAHHQWEEDYNTFKTFFNVDQALKKQIITVFEPMYLDILNDNMVGFANTSAHEMITYLFTTYGSNTPVDLDHNFETMRNAWDPHQPVDTMFKQIKYSVDCSEAGGFTIGSAHHISVAYTRFFTTFSFMSARHRWNEKEEDNHCGHWVLASTRHIILIFTVNFIVVTIVNLVFVFPCSISMLNRHTHRALSWKQAAKLEGYKCTSTHFIKLRQWQGNKPQLKIVLCCCGHIVSRVNCHFPVKYFETDTYNTLLNNHADFCKPAGSDFE
jgi:hypothetical protein